MSHRKHADLNTGFSGGRTLKYLGDLSVAVFAKFFFGSIQNMLDDF